jgi:hypothetical protein
MVNPREIGAYKLAQKALVDLKTSIYALLTSGPEEGLTNAQIGRGLGIYMGHVGHEGHIHRTLLAIMEAEGIVDQDGRSKKWKIKNQMAE